MARSWVTGLRITSVALFIALAAATVQPARTFAAGPTITLTPNSGVVGSTVGLTGSGFTPGTVTVYFNTTFLGSTNVSTTGVINALFTVPALPANQTYNVTICPSTGTTNGCFTSATFQIVPAVGTLGNVALSKFIQTGSGFASCPNGGGCTVQNVAGASETYAVQYQNLTGATIGQLTITDTLQPGQVFASASAGCAAGAASSTTGLVTVTCTTSNVPAGAIGSVTVATRPASGFTGVITNQACASVTGFAGQACSNTTYLTVSGNLVTTSTQICGLVSAYIPAAGASAGSITIGGQTFTIAPSAQISGTITTAAPNNNVCITFMFVNGFATALTVTSNLALVNVVCGVLTVFSPATSSITVAGFAYPASSSVMASAVFVTGQTYCFLVQNGTLVGVLTGIPTAAHAVAGGAYHHKRLIAE